MIDWRLGTMGFSYDHWAGVFYPKGMKPGDRLAWYARHFDAVELDTTFHAVPPVDRVRHWGSCVPEHFRFCAKAPKAVTHEALARDASPQKALSAMSPFLEAMAALGPKLAVVAFQFPPAFPLAAWDMLREFLEGLMPAARGILPGVRFAVEFREPSWSAPASVKAVTGVLAELGCARVSNDYHWGEPAVWPGADFLYIRWLGRHGVFESLDHEQIDVSERLAWWKRHIERSALVQASDRPGGAALDQSTTVWGFFNNNYAGYSVGTCNRFKTLLGLPIRESSEGDAAGQGTLFG